MSGGASKTTVRLGADATRRLAIWRAFGATTAEAEELRAYACSPVHQALPERRSYPRPDPPHVLAWERYAADAAVCGPAGAAMVLRRIMVQLAFPIREGMSQTAAYLAATRRGQRVERNTPGLEFERRGGLHIELRLTPVGRVPIVLAESRADFETLVRAVTHHNEPAAVPASMGACLVAGYNNWDRIDQLHRAHEARRAADAGLPAWDAAFQALIPCKDLYQDRFMLISTGCYSAVPASAMDLPDDEWLARSLRLRIAHECTHYCARYAIGAMRVSVLDELVADYFGLIEAFGEFRAAPFLRFMGLEDYPAYRRGGRLENYRGKPPLSNGAFARLPAVLVRAAERLEALDPLRTRPHAGQAERMRVLLALMCVGVEGLVAVDATERFAAALAEASAAVDDLSLDGDRP